MFKAVYLSIIAPFISFSSIDYTPSIGLTFHFQAKHRPFYSTNHNFSDSLKTIFLNPIEIEKKDKIETATRLQFKYSILLGIPVEELANNQLLEFIQSWFGTRYLWGGNSKKGIDCSAFTQRLLSEVFGVKTGRIVGDQYQKSKKIKKSDLRLGDLIFFNFKGGSSLGHVAYYLGNDWFVHATVNKGITFSNLNETYYAKGFRFAGRPEYADGCMPLD